MSKQPTEIMAMKQANCGEFHRSATWTLGGADMAVVEAVWTEETPIMVNVQHAE